MQNSDNVSMFYGAKPIIFERAKAMRKQMTQSELLVWNVLKEKQILGLRFRAQHPIDIFIADFYCHPLKLVIEIDGGVHQSLEQMKYDIGRSAELNRWGIKVVRSTNEEVENNIEAVKRKIKFVCEKLYRSISPL